MDDDTVLDSISAPADLRTLTPDELRRLAGEIRALIVGVVAKNGGHLASNLGGVELTLALHRVFDFRRDRLFFDVGHQCYAHKIVTGRRDAFGTLRRKGGLSGFPAPAESDYDPLMVGHASTSISSAVGFAEAMRGAAERRQGVALIGDGSIGGGLSFEALNHAGQKKSDVLVILNDNDMSIAATTGALSGYLTDLRTRPATRTLRESLSSFLSSLPVAGKHLKNMQEYILHGVKGLAEATPVFSALGFRYFGPLDGHDLPLLETELRRIKDIEGPRILHVATEKGRGYAAAAADPEAYHSPAPFEVRSQRQTLADRKRRAYTDVFAEKLVQAAGRDPDIVAITAAMPAGTGIRSFGAAFPERFYDVGICESHAVAFAASLAKSGKRPVLALYSTFLQRGYDQIVHDVAVQSGLPLVIAIDRAGLVGNDGPTHHGVFDIAFLRHIPGLTLMAPRDGAELEAMLNLALAQPGAVAIRYPRGTTPDSDADAARAGWPAAGPPVAMGKAEVLREGTDGAILAYGRMVYPAWLAGRELARHGLNVAVVNARFAKPLDGDLLRALAQSQPWLATVEDHALAGGFGSAVLEFLADNGLPVRCRRFGIPDRFVSHAEIDELDHELGLTPSQIAADILHWARDSHTIV